MGRKEVNAKSLWNNVYIRTYQFLCSQLHQLPDLQLHVTSPKQPNPRS